MSSRMLLRVVVVFGLPLFACGKESDGRERAIPPPETAKPAAGIAAPAEPAINAAVAKPRPAPLGECPPATSITALKSQTDISEAGPFDWSEFTIAKAISTNNGKLVQIFIANRDFDGRKMANGLQTPVKQPGEGVLTLTLYNGDDPITIGEYRAGKDKEPFGALAELQVVMGGKGVFVGLGINKGVVRLVDQVGDQICGDFEVMSKHSMAKGTFVAELVPLDIIR